MNARLVVSALRLVGKSCGELCKGLNNGTVCLAIDKGKRGIGNAYTSREICPTRTRYSVPRPARAPHGRRPSAYTHYKR